ncbi:MAG: rhodanese-like domain-containing protein [Pseudomonadota bacterium]
MQQVIEFIGNHPVLSGAFIILLIVWLGWEMARLGRKWRELDSQGAVRLINQDDSVILDVSNSADFAKGHIVGAIHMPPTRIEAGNKELLKYAERPVLVYCKNGQLSPQTAGKLVALGFTNVNVLMGGLAQWLADQQPISRAKGSGKSKPRGEKQKKGKKGKKVQDNSESQPASDQQAEAEDQSSRSDQTTA